MANSPPPVLPPSEVELFSRALLRRLLVPMIVAGVAYGALLFYADLDAIVRHTKEVAGTVIVWGTVLASLNYVIRFWRWTYYLKLLDISLKWSDSLLVFLAGFAMSITPGKLGEVLKALLLKDSHSIPVARTAPIVLAERITDLAGLLLLAALGLLTIPGAAIAAVAALGMVVLLLSIVVWRKLGIFLIDLVARLRPLRPFRSKLHAAYDSLSILSRPMAVVVGASSSLVAWGFQCVSLNVFAAGFPETELSIPDGLVAYAAPVLAGTLALVPGGLGITEASMAGVLQSLGGPGMTPSVAAAITILSRVSSFWLAIAIGFLSLAIWRARRRKVEAQASTAR